MIKYLIPVSLFALFATAMVGCNNSENSGKENDSDSLTVIESDQYEEFEQYMSEVDANGTYSIANSMYYSNQAGEAVEVRLYLEEINADSSELVKMEELMVAPVTGVVFSNIFYYKDGLKYLTRQYFQEGNADSLYFVELRTYYDKKEKPVVTKRRTAPYEELLDQETFAVVDSKDCSDERAFRCINQEGEFETTFQGFVDMSPFLYLIVGENKKDGYASSLIVQSRNEIINQLVANESNWIGKPLIVRFEIIQEGGGQEQILTGISYP